ncbi:TfoX/Sxy family protein [Terrabacter sp. NPDC000476]|uniref:TfoX/Sxy family protein n=1 Tax=Terrabacter sp. NPDC000476 TaxID=3154258 RepID=UPI00332FD4AB
MAYDRDLAEQIRRLTSGVDDVSERQMFGGLAFLVNGNMAVAVSGQGGLLVRVDPVAADAWIDGERVTPMEMRGRPMHGWLHVLTDRDSHGLEEWVSRGIDFARSLPSKRK